jgi:tetratricopeptide (TPR) repeat protein
MSPKTSSAVDKRALRLIDAALDLQEAGDHERAVEILVEARSLTPDYAPLYLLLGLAYRDGERYEEAESSLRRAVDLDPEQIEAVESLVLLLCDTDRSPEAIQLLQERVQKRMGDSQRFRLLAEMLQRTGQSAEAMEMVEQALALDEGDVRAWLVKGWALEDLGRHADAIEAARSGMEHLPSRESENSDLLEGLGRLELAALSGSGQAEEALARAEQLQQRYPAMPLFPVLRATLLFGMDRREDALRVLNEAVEAGLDTAALVRAGFVAAYRLLAEWYKSLHAQGCPEEAWKVARAYLPEDTPDLWGIVGPNIAHSVQSLYMEGKVAASHAAYEQLRELYGDPAGFSYWMAEDFAPLDLAEAQRYWSLALQQSPDTELRVAILAALGYCYLIEGRLAEANERLSEAIMTEVPQKKGGVSFYEASWWDGQEALPTARPSEGVSKLPAQGPAAHAKRVSAQEAAMANLVNLAQLEGHLEEIEATARHIVAEAPESTRGYKLLGWVLRAQGRYNEARQAWQEAFVRLPPRPRGVIGVWEGDTISRWLADLPT